MPDKTVGDCSSSAQTARPSASGLGLFRRAAPRNDSYAPHPNPLPAGGERVGVRGITVIARSGATKQSQSAGARACGLRRSAIARAVRAVAPILLLASLSACAQLAPPPESAAEPRMEAIYVLRGGWHTELVLPVSLIE